MYSKTVSYSLDIKMHMVLSQWQKLALVRVYNTTILAPVDGELDYAPSADFALSDYEHADFSAVVYQNYSKLIKTDFNTRLLY